MCHADVRMQEGAIVAVVADEIGFQPHFLSAMVAGRPPSQTSVLENALEEETILMAMRELQRSDRVADNGKASPDGGPPKDEPGAVYLSGSRRKVDFVLVYSPAKGQALRDVFEEELLKAGLLLEYVPQNSSGLCFVKIHAPWEVLSCFAEIMRLKMPVKEVWADV